MGLMHRDHAPMVAGPGTRSLRGAGLEFRWRLGVAENCTQPIRPPSGTPIDAPRS